MSMSSDSGVIFDRLNFDNQAIKKLPIDTEQGSYSRTVRGACYSMIAPTSLKNVRLVSYSANALELLDIKPSDANSPEFIEYFSGNRIMEGSQTYSHCYCGHQFGSWACQLGDGAAIYLGEIVNGKGERYDLQLKGAGPTPYSREFDGRKILASSIREFLASEALHHLGIPTTRSGSCITSDDTVDRPTEDHRNMSKEQCTVISRIAPTFIRFGSFQIFKLAEPGDFRHAPSIGREDIKRQLIDFLLEFHFPEINQQKIEYSEKVKLFFTQVTKRTAHLLARWQCNGFCHGVLNTDNMSILGLTLDYGPYGFMDRFERNHICNSSDTSGRYTYEAQPKICHWNLLKLAQVLHPILDHEEGKRIVDEVYYREFEQLYSEIMNQKLGLLNSLSESHDGVKDDKSLVESFLDTLEETGSDFTISFRKLASIKLPGVEGHEKSCQDLIEFFVENCSTTEELTRAVMSSSTYQSVRNNLAFFQASKKNPAAFESCDFKVSFLDLQDDLAKVEKLTSKSETERVDNNRILWNQWMDSYLKRLQYDCHDLNGDSLTGADEKRRQLMNSVNPKYILRNFIARRAIQRAKNDDFSEVWKVLKVLERPYDEEIDVQWVLSQLPPGMEMKCMNFEYLGRRPTGTDLDLVVSCTS